MYLFIPKVIIAVKHVGLSSAHRKDNTRRGQGGPLGFWAVRIKASVRPAGRGKKKDREGLWSV